MLMTYDPHLVSFAKPIGDDLAISGQISLPQIELIAAAGFKTLLCNRLDDEDPGQLSFATIAAAAKQRGLEAVYQPVVSGNVTAQDVAAFANHMASLQKPVFAYCRSGTRCLMMWQASQR